MPQLDFANPLILTQVLWLLVIFGALYVLLSKVALPPVAKVLADREAAITADLETARTLKAEADAAIAAQEKAGQKARTEAQAASLEQTAGSLGTIAEAASRNTDSAVRADGMVLAAATVAGHGGQAVERVGATMQEISASSSRIGDIIGLIDGIAFQTNLLALNAAVEAARAGEQGRGFAVVAGEVRSLAQRTAGAAREITGLIEASRAHVGQGGQLVGAAGQTMRDVVGKVADATAIMSAITAASREQAREIDGVNAAMVELDAITRRNAAQVEESAAASGNVADEAARLSLALSVFKFGTTTRPALAGLAALDAPHGIIRYGSIS